MQVSIAPVLRCFLLVAAMMASCDCIAGWQPGNTRVPGTSVTAHAPKGWVCSADGTSWSNGKATRFVDCLPAKGGVAFRLQEMIAHDRPLSIDAYLNALVSEEAAKPDSFVRQPHRFDIAGRPAVESASRGMAIFDLVGVDKDGKSSEQSETVSDVTVIADHGTFYECLFSTTTRQYTEPLRRSYQNFCSSLTFGGH